MICGIYCWENNTNHKKYIGQSVNILQRWRNELSRAYQTTSNEYDSLLSRAIRKYGKESFNRTILEECPIEQLNEREKYYIAKYNTISPNGYNLTAGGDSNAHLKTTPQKILDIKEDLRNSLLTQAEIAKKYNLHWRSISDINVGKMWADLNENYPIRKYMIRHKGDERIKISWKGNSIRRR